MDLLGATWWQWQCAQNMLSSFSVINCNRLLRMGYVVPPITKMAHSFPFSSPEQLRVGQPRGC